MFNYCPKCNDDNIEFRDQQYFLCSKCNFIYYHNIAAAVAAIISCQGKILFTTRAKSPSIGLLGLPGGFVDPDESLEQALSREIQEELSLELSNWQYFCSQPNIYLYKNIETRTLDSFFVAELESMPTCVLQASEISDAFWLKPEQIDFENIAFPSIKAALKIYLDGATTKKK